MAEAIIDTNIILGQLVRGDDKLEIVLKKYSEVILPTQVFFESVYTLESYYKVKRVEIVEMFSRLLQIINLSSEKILLLDSLYLYRDNSKLSLVDCYLVVLAKEKKCELISDDKDILKLL